MVHLRMLDEHGQASTFALGTAAGDLATEALGLGFTLGAVIFAALIGVTLHGPWGWSLFGIVWGMAVIGMNSSASATSSAIACLLPRPCFFRALRAISI